MYEIRVAKSYLQVASLFDELKSLRVKNQNEQKYYLKMFHVFLPTTVLFSDMDSLFLAYEQEFLG